MPGKLSIRLHESSESLQGEFERLQDALKEISAVIGSHSPIESLWESIIDIQDGAADSAYGTAAEIAENLARKQERINGAFASVFQQLEKYK